MECNVPTCRSIDGMTIYDCLTSCILYSFVDVGEVELKHVVILHKQ